MVKLPNILNRQVDIPMHNESNVIQENDTTDVEKTDTKPLLIFILKVLKVWKILIQTPTHSILATW